MSAIQQVLLSYGASDPYFSSVVALLHMDGADTSTTFTDVKGHTFTASGTAQIDTAQSKFGGASGQFGNASGYLTAANSTDWDIPGDWTCECLFRITSTGFRFLFSRGEPTAQALAYGAFLNTDNKMYFTMNANEGGVYTLYTDSTVSTATWYHLAIQRRSGVWEMFLDGTKQTRTYASATDLTSTLALGVGTQNLGGGGQMDGHLDEFRITKGVARYSGNFSVPTAAYPDA